MVDQDQDGIDRGMNIIRKNYDISVQRGRLLADQVSSFLSNLKATTDWQMLKGADLVIEAVFENLEVKQQVFKQLDDICDPHTILASNTSYQSIDALAAVTEQARARCRHALFQPCECDASARGCPRRCQ